MSPTDPDNGKPGTQEAESLVAYLDGELSAEEAQRVEERLGGDAAYRRELARLQRAWDALDELPATAVDDSFTRSTIAMVALAAEDDLKRQQAAAPARRRARVLSLLMLSAGVLAAGFIATAALWPDRNQELIGDLPVLENLDAYRHVERVEYLKLLRDAGLFENAPGSPDAEPADDQAAETAGTSSRPGESQADPRAQIMAMSTEEKAQLAAAQQRFAALPENTKQRLRDLHQAIDADSSAEQLRRTLAHYHQWLKELSQGQQADLLTLPPAERVAEVTKLYGQQQQRRARVISSQDQKAVLIWLGKYLKANRQRLLAEVPDSRRRELQQRLEGMNEEQQGASLAMLLWQRGARKGGPPLVVPGEEEVQQLAAQLSAQARQQLEQAGTREAKKKVVAGWIQHSLRQRMAPRYPGAGKQPTSSELESFFTSELNSDQRERLLALPRQEMQEELRRLFLAARGEPPGHARAGDERRGPPGERPEGKHRFPDGEFHRPFGDGPRPHPGKRWDREGRPPFPPRPGDGPRDERSPPPRDERPPRGDGFPPREDGERSGR